LNQVLKKTHNLGMNQFAWYLDTFGYV